MHRKHLITALAIVVLLAMALPMGALATGSLQQGDNPETLLEQAAAAAAEQAGASPDAGHAFSLPAGGVNPLFVGVDDTTVPAYLMDVTNSSTTQAFVGYQVWGGAYDAANDKVYFNNGSTLYEWPVGGAVATLGTITDPAGATQSMTGLAFYNGTLYGVKNIANEAVYAIDTTTRVATVYIDYLDADYDFGGLAADPNTGTLYATNDDTTPHGSGLFRINPDATGTLIAAYPAGQTDIDGLAVSHDGYAYLVIDEPGNIYVWDFGAAAYTTPLTSPWTSSEIFSAGAWIPPASGGDPNIYVDPLSMASTQPPDVQVQDTLTISNTGGGTLTWQIDEESTLFEAGTPSGSKDAPAGPQTLSAGGPYAHGMKAVAPVFRGGEALVNDGSFENGPPPGSAWTETTNSTCEWIGDWSGVWGVAAYDGIMDFWGAGYCNGTVTTSSVAQTVAVPPANTTLSFWIISYRPDADDPDLDQAYVEVNGTPVWTYDLTQANDTYPNWVNVTVDLSAYAGQNVSLELGATSAGASTGNIRFDYVEFAGPPSPACTVLSDMPWLSLAPTSGANSGGTDIDVTVTFDSTGMTPGVYTGNLCVTSDDPDPGPGNETDLVIVPVTLTVEGEPPRCPVGTTEITLLTEDFEGSFPPAGWTVSNTTTGCTGVPDWTNTDPGANGNLTGGTGLFATADSDACGSGSVMNAQMWTPVMDLTGLTDPQVAYYTDYNDIATGGEFAYLDFSTDSGSNWSNLLTWDEDHRGPLLVEQPFAGDNQPNTVLRWNYSNATWDWWWQVDEVVVTACEPIGGGDPNIDVDPLSMASTQQPNIQVQQTLTISNTGGGTLTWDIDEENTTLPPIDAPAVLTPQPAAEVMGTPEGAAPEAHGQAALWRGPAAVLYDNGPQVTHPGGGAGGADASALQTALGLSTYGFGHAVSSGFRVADDFTVPAGGWNVNTITFFAYQTGSTTTSTINAVNVRIWDGPPNAGGSVIWGDTTTNRLASSAWSNAYRVLDTALTNNQRPIMADVATIGTFLPAGTYWVDWQTGGTLASGPWAHPVSILGQVAKPGANALQYDPTAATWNALIDTGASAQQDLPFIVEGTAGGSAPCSAALDMAWLTLSPTSGSNGGGTDTDVTVTFDSTGLPNGTYTGNLCITSNDPDAGPGNETDLVIVPVTLTVLPPTAVALTDLAADAGQSPAPLASLPLATLPAAAAAALGAAFVWRRRRS